MHGTDEETEATTKGGDTARSEIKGTEEEKTVQILPPG